MQKLIIDHTRTYGEGVRGFQEEQSHHFEKEGWNARMLHLYSHAGTHMDAPSHFNISGPSIDQFPLDALIGKAHVLKIPVSGDKFLITPEHVSLTKHNIRAGDRLLFQTGWSKQHGLSGYRDAQPRISRELADWIVERQIKLIGVEGPSVADVNNLSEVTAIHQTLFKAGVIIVEGLINLELLKNDTVEFFALPLKIKNGDGAPCRAFSIEYVEDEN